MSGELLRTEVDDVPVFYVDTAQTPTAVLTFRAGFADESLATRGWIHLLEHMAMEGSDDPSVHCNASVGALTTEFQIRGDERDVVTFLDRVCGWLTEPRFDQLEHERSVLEAESSQRRFGDVTSHLDYRYGARGVGTANYAELGLRTATPEKLSQVARELFTAGNAVLALNVRPPDGLRLPLAQGPRVPAPAAMPLPLRLPGHAAAATPDLAVSGVVFDSPLSPVVGEVLTRAVTDELRHRRSSSYATQFHIERVDEEQLVLVLISDLLEKSRLEGVELLSGIVNRCANDPETLGSVASICARALREIRNDTDAAWQAQNSALAHLRGAPPVTREAVTERLSAVTPEEVQAEIGQFATTALYTSPAGKEARTRLPFNTGVSEAPARGVPRVFRGWGASDPSVLEISDQTVRIYDEQDISIGRALDQVAAYLTYPDGARVLVAQDGGVLGLEPTAWHRGEEAVALLDSLVHPDHFVPMPEREPDQIPRRPFALRRVYRAIPWWAFLTLAAVLLFGFVALLASAGRFPSAFSVVGAGLGTWWLVRHGLRQREERRAPARPRSEPA